MDVIRAMVDARISQNLTQKELAERTGINQADISKLENGTRNLFNMTSFPLPLNIRCDKEYVSSETAPPAKYLSLSQPIT